jgi:DNA-binding MarR family transcriptional regulator
VEPPGGVGFLLGAAHRRRRRAWERAIADLGLGAPQAALLRLVSAQPGIGVREAARRMATDPMQAQRVASALEAAGLLVSGLDPTDARRRPLRATARGVDLAAELTSRAAVLEADLRQQLGPATYSALLAGLAALAELPPGPEAAGGSDPQLASGRGDRRGGTRGPGALRKAGGTPAARS